MPDYRLPCQLAKSPIIYAWGPDPEALVRLVSAGRLPGTVDEGSVVLGPLGQEHYAQDAGLG